MGPYEKFKRAASLYNFSDFEQFDEKSKTCTMNCGRHKDDPRSEKERKFVCKDCLKTKVSNVQIEELADTNSKIGYAP